jgi:ubiquinone biosynthesis protein UbiJ
MTDVTSDFLEGLAAGGPVPSLGRTSGTLRFDVDRDGTTHHWFLAIRRGSVTVTRSDAEAGCVLRVPASLLDDLVTGRANAMAASLRNELTIAGDPALLVRFQRLFPSPTTRKQTSSARTVGKRRG